MQVKTNYSSRHILCSRLGSAKGQLLLNAPTHSRQATARYLLYKQSHGSPLETMEMAHIGFRQGPVLLSLNAQNVVVAKESRNPYADNGHAASPDFKFHM